MKIIIKDTTRNFKDFPTGSLFVWNGRLGLKIAPTLAFFVGDNENICIGEGRLCQDIKSVTIEVS